MKTVVARYSNVDPSSDLDHASWSGVEPVPITHLWSGEEAPPSRHGEARIIWSNQALAVRFICRQSEPLLVSSEPVLDRKTIYLWDRDVCEIFIAPDRARPKRYFEFEAAPTGEWVDLIVNLESEEPEKDFNYQSGMSVTTRVNEGELRLAMRIPWSNDLPKPQRGDEWRANLFRCIGIGDERYMAWQPTYAEEPNFHVPEAFGVLKFD